MKVQTGTNAETDVLIVGAGPTGLGLALQLHWLGVRCRLIEKKETRSTTSKAIGLQYRVSEVLNWMGVVDRFDERAARSGNVNLYPYGGPPLAIIRLGGLTGRSGRGAFAPHVIILPQSQTEELLGNALREQGGAIEWNTAFVDLEQSAEQVVSRVATPEGVETITSRYVVSCEGAHSQIRKQLNFSFAGQSFPHDFFMADVDLDWARNRGDSYVWLHPDGLFSALSLPGDRHWRLFIEAGSAADEEVSLALIQKLLIERSDDHVTVASNPTWLTRFKIHSRMVDRFSQGRVFLAGDAAHLHSPLGGQGITTGLQDAYNLAWKLAAVLKQGAPEALLDTYSQERLPIVRDVLRTTETNTNIFLAQTSFRKWIRNHVMMPILGLPLIQRRMISKLSQLDQNYRTSPLTRQRRSWLPTNSLREGDRSPDVLFRRKGTHEEISLFAMLQRGQFVALLTVGSRSFSTREDALKTLRIPTYCVDLGLGHGDSPGDEPEWLVDSGDFAKFYGRQTDRLWLIRPDGYVGLHCSIDQVRTIQEYLAHFWSSAAIAQAFREDAIVAPWPEAFSHSV